MIRLLQGIFASMSLERKSLLFFGSALLVLMGIAFWIIQFLANKNVLEGSHQRARDFSDAELLRIHTDAVWQKEAPPVVVKSEENRDLLNALRLDFLTDDLDFQILGLPDPVPYENLPPATPPATQQEFDILKQLEAQFRSQLALAFAGSQVDIAHPIDLGENAAMRQFGPSSQPLHKGYGPINDIYYYYRPIFPTLNCVPCHAPQSGQVSIAGNTEPMRRAQEYPFRVFKVAMSYQPTREKTTVARAILISIAMLIIAVTLFVLHSIVRYLVLDPLYHLRDVSDAITHGDTNQRANIDTDDEFRELADAFNRMLRHLTETQDQIQDVNRELDSRVDQLAQLNLQLYEANRVKSDFLANMSHELRTPLNSIIGFSEVLAGIESLSDKQRRYANNIQKSGRTLLDMINDILDLAKMEAGKMEVRRTEFDLGRLVQAQCDMIGSLAEDKNISLTVQLPDDMPMAFQDANKLGQIINNLLSNGIKFTPEGGMIAVRVSDQLDGHFRISISDTGVGIAAEDQPIIFQKFRQSRKVLDGEGLTREFAGTGLGLSIVKELTRLLGGEISFESELGRGSTFWLDLPWRLSESASPLAGIVTNDPSGGGNGAEAGREVTGKTLESSS
jgi:signal transduction histidine kinase